MYNSPSIKGKVALVFFVDIAFNKYRPRPFLIDLEHHAILIQAQIEKIFVIKSVYNRVPQIFCGTIPFGKPLQLLFLIVPKEEAGE